MPNRFWIVMLPGKLEETYPTLEVTTEAAIRCLRENPDETKIAVQEFDEKGMQKRGRIIFRMGDYFHFVNSEWI